MRQYSPKIKMPIFISYYFSKYINLLLKPNSKQNHWFRVSVQKLSF